MSMRAVSPPSSGPDEGDWRRFLIVIENAGANYSAYSPDLPGCVATGSTREVAERNMVEAIRLHIEGLREDHLPIPGSSSFAEFVVVPAPG
jgi:predicted RNase H-like HicB family nuclease